MRMMRTATAICIAALFAGSPASAQTTPPAAGAKPKPAGSVWATIPLPTDAAGAAARADRLALQSDLAWVGQYNGAINGEASARTVDAVKQYQKLKGGSPTGVFTPQERAALADAARRNQDNVGWKVITEPTTGARIGIPGKLVPTLTSDANGAKWNSAAGNVQIILARRKEANPTTAALAEREKAEPAGRIVAYSVVKPDFFVVSGTREQKKFYIRGTFKGDEVRVLTILYDPALETTVAPVVIAMSSAFNAFPTQSAAPAPRRGVEYGTGLVVSSDGAIIADREVTEGCLATTIPGLGHADRVADDKAHGLALLRVYGARGLKPLDVGPGKLQPALDITGIADPQNQGGGLAATSAKAQAITTGSSNTTLTPAPALGFSGAVAQNSDGKFAGIALSKQTVVAGPANTPNAQGVLVPAETVRTFLATNGVAIDGTSSDAKAAVVRVICVRK